VRRPGLDPRELAEGTAHGRLYLERLRRAQLALALLALIAFGGLIGALPLVLLLVPSLAQVELLGVPLPLWLVVVVPFPLFLAIGWLFQRRADGLDEQFRALVSGDDG
jgi:putative solute:sodium symporter small subunit